MKHPFSKFRTNRLSTTIILMVEVVLLLSNSLFCAVSIVNSRLGIRRSIQQRMLDIANCASGSMNGDVLGSLRAQDEGTAKYQSVYDTLAIFRDNVELEYVYAIRDEGGGRFTFTVDTDPNAPGAFGSEVEYTDALASAARGRAAVDTVPYTDAWGTFYSAYSPVYDSSGHVAGIIACDFSEEWFHDQLSAQTRSTVVSYCVILLVTLLSAAFLSLIAVTPFVRRQEQLSDEVRRRADENEQLFLHTVRSLADAVDAKDPYTNGHSYRVSRYSVLLAETLGWDRERVDKLRYAALLHDIGKIGVPDSILNSPKKLTAVEYGIVKSHTGMGSDILNNGIMDEIVVNVARCHHEWYDGQGYPAGLKGEDIPIEARIVAIADAFDAMSSNRIYRQACSAAHICRELREGSGKQFDPRLVDLFVGLWDKGMLSDIMEQHIAPSEVRADKSCARLRELAETFAAGEAAVERGASNVILPGIVREEGGGAAALEAEYARFVRLYAKRAEGDGRLRRPFTLVLLSMDPAEGESAPGAYLGREMWFMERAIRQIVGSGDILTRCGRNRFLLLVEDDAAAARRTVDRVLLEYFKMNGSSVHMPSCLIARPDGRGEGETPSPAHPIRT